MVSSSLETFFQDPNCVSILRRMHRRIQESLHEVDAGHVQRYCDFVSNEPPQPHTGRLPVNLQRLPPATVGAQTLCRMPRGDGTHDGVFPNFKDGRLHYYKVKSNGYQLYCQQVRLAYKRYREAKHANGGNEPPLPSWQWNTLTEECFHMCHKGKEGCLQRSHIRLSTKNENRKASLHHCFLALECIVCQKRTFYCMHLPQRCTQIKGGRCEDCT